MKRFLLVYMMIIIISACTSDNDFAKGKGQLEMMGYTDVKNTGHEFLCCDDKDTFSTGFPAKDKNGKTVKGCFCSKMFKGVTVRLE